MRDDFDKERRPSSLWNELAEVDNRFGDFRETLGWEANPSQWEAEAKKTVNEYIAVMSNHSGELTPENLMSDRVRFSGKVDPVFAVLLRAIAGPQIMTGGVFDKIRDSWCHSDLPGEVDELIRIQDDFSFVKKFEEAQLDDWGNIKLLALQRIGIRDLVDESRQKREGK
jgi:hypothetical protein